mmetsp:Transcript_34277/g.80837  ORF Transcript_34277/g.80837 Transcript_34277/m.80837 type:complete len:269 (+) Transcript_34277:1897-2703(+)
MWSDMELKGWGSSLMAADTHAGALVAAGSTDPKGFGTTRLSADQSCMSYGTEARRTQSRETVEAILAHCRREAGSKSSAKSGCDEKRTSSSSVWFDLSVKLAICRLISVSTAAVVVTRNHSSKPFAAPVALSAATCSSKASSSVSGQKRPLHPAIRRLFQCRAHPWSSFQTLPMGCRAVRTRITLSRTWCGVLTLGHCPAASGSEGSIQSRMRVRWRWNRSNISDWQKPREVSAGASCPRFACSLLSFFFFSFFSSLTAPYPASMLNP